MVVAGRAFDLNLLLSSSKVSLLTRKQIPRPCTGNIGSINRRKKIEYSKWAWIPRSWDNKIFKPI